MAAARDLLRLPLFLHNFTENDYEKDFVLHRNHFADVGNMFMPQRSLRAGGNRPLRHALCKPASPRQRVCQRQRFRPRKGRHCGSVPHAFRRPLARPDGHGPRSTLRHRARSLPRRKGIDAVGKGEARHRGHRHRHGNRRRSCDRRLARYPVQKEIKKIRGTKKAAPDFKVTTHLKRAQSACDAGAAMPQFHADCACFFCAKLCVVRQR